MGRFAESSVPGSLSCRALVCRSPRRVHLLDWLGFYSKVYVQWLQQSLGKRGSCIDSDALDLGCLYTARLRPYCTW